MKSIREMDLQDRPREKLVKKGVQALSDRELIAVVIGSGVAGRDVNQVAADILKMMKKQGSTLAFDDLTTIQGVGPTKACQMVAAFELARRFLVKETDGVTRITCPDDVLPLVGILIAKKQEHFVCITLNGAGELLEQRTITVGTLNHSPVHPREVFADAITDRAASVIFVHNHPSGNPEPSSQDIAITRQLKDAGEILGIRVQDHVIIASRGHTSLRERGLL
jgi:DNA repair protein RadC